MLELFFNRLGTAVAAPKGRFIMATDGRTIALLGLLMVTGPTCPVAATEGRSMEGAAFLAGGAFGPDGPCLGLRVGSFLAGGTTDLGPGFATGMVGSRGAVIAAAIRADGEIMTGTAAFTGGGAFMAFGNSFTFRDGGAGFGPADERLIPNTGGVGAFDLDRPGAGDFAWS